MSRAILSLGSNLGDRVKHLRRAVELLGDRVLLASGIYETPPWFGDTAPREDPPYLNGVLMVVDPKNGPGDWLALARRCEEDAGRTRDPERHFAPRTLDVDVIEVYDADDQPVISDDPELTLPHPRAHLRAFVLKPWLDIQPYARLTGHGWLTDLLNQPGLAADAEAMSPHPDLALLLEP
ncbi:MAG: 2-amino-4-hydroxy-6-hydroxymethyldihydropteridine diphosphokinase [Actinoplanes sp.]